MITTINRERPQQQQQQHLLQNQPNRVIRALLARFLCLLHVTSLGFVLFHAPNTAYSTTTTTAIKQTPQTSLAFLVPTLGALALVAESAWMVVVRRGRPAFAAFFSTCFAIYVPTVVVSYWYLELDNLPPAKLFIKGLTSSSTTIRSYRLFKSDLVSTSWSSTRLTWTRIELQLFLAIIILIRWLALRSNPTNASSYSPHLLKYLVIACDMLDFLSITQDSVLGLNTQLVYWTLSAWSWSTIQFFVRIPPLSVAYSLKSRLFIAATSRDPEEIRGATATAYLSNSLLGVVFLDLPYFGIRAAAILAFGSHSLNSYFFAAKNLVLIVCQLYKIKDTFLEREEEKLEEATGCGDGGGGGGAFLSQLRLKDGEITAGLAGDLSIQNSLDGLADDNNNNNNNNYSPSPVREESIKPPSAAVVVVEEDAMSRLVGGGGGGMRPIAAISLEQIMDEQVRRAAAAAAIVMTKMGGIGNNGGGENGNHYMNNNNNNKVNNSMQSIYCGEDHQTTTTTTTTTTNWNNRLACAQHALNNCSLLPPPTPLSPVASLKMKHQLVQSPVVNANNMHVVRPTVSQPLLFKKFTEV